MATRIKGIKIEIGGDLQPLNKALAGTEKEIRSVQTQLKDVERLLKLDPKNTELMQQKQKLLAQAVGETKDKLETLKAAEQKVQDQVAQGKASEEQYNALKREIVATEQALKNLETQAKTSNSTLAKVGDAVENISQKSAAVSSATKPITVGIAAAAAASVVAMDRVDDGLDTVMKKTGATGQNAKDLQKIYNEVATTVPGDFGDIGAAVGEVNTRLNFTGDALKTASVNFLEFAKVNDMDVNSAVQLVSRAMGDAGIEASQYNSVLDMLTVAAQKSGIGVDTLATNLAKYGAPMRALSIDTKNAIALFAGWEKAGVNTEIAFSGMKKAISTWSAAGKDAGTEFQNVMQQIKEAPDIACATTIAIEAFGSKAGPDLADAIRGGRFEVDEYIAALKNAGGAVDDTYRQIVDDVDKTQLAMQTAQVSVHDLGEMIMKALGPILLNMAKWLQGVTMWFGSLDSGTQTAILTTLALVAAISPVAGIISKISAAVKVVTGTVIPALGKALTMLSANPVVFIVAAVAALVAGFIYLWNTSEDFRNFWINLWNNIKAAFEATWNAIVSFFTVIIPEAINGVIGIFQGFDNWLTGIFSTDWSESFGMFGEIINGFFTNVSNVWESIKQVFQGVIDFVTGIFTGDWSKAWEGIKSIFSGVWNGFIAIVKAPINGILALINAMIDGINWVIEKLNTLSFEVPDWVPIVGGQKWGFNIPKMGKIPYLAKGGTLNYGSAVVGEAGPELLTVREGKAQVTPLNPAAKAAGWSVGGEISVTIGTVYNYDTDTDTNSLAEIIGEKINRQAARKGAVFG